jgi:tRNA (guanine37-N1)-methyltransferase
VPDVLLSGDHARVARWRREQALWLTWRRRPELLAEASLTDEERRLIERFERGEAPTAPARGERDEGHGRDSHR